MVTPYVIAVAFVFIVSSPVGGEAAALCVGHEATAIALVSLHEGPNCSLVSLRGIQQQAAILDAAKAADGALSKNGINLRVRVFDSCSNPREAVSATLRSLAAFPHACLQPPLLLGFLGPDDSPSLEAVQKVTRVFNINHAVPFRLDSSPMANKKQGPMYVTSDRTDEQLQAVVQLVVKLQWTRVTLLHTADAVTSQLASALTRRLCVVGAPMLLPEYGAGIDNYSSIMGVLTGDESSPVVILAGSALPVTQFFRLAQNGPHAYLVMARSAGLLPELTSLAVAAPVLVLQYTSGRQQFDSGLWEQYRHQRQLPGTGDIQSLLADVQDPTVTPMAHAVRLYGSALSVVHQARCQGRPGPCPMLSAVSPEQWRNLLSVAMVNNDLAAKRIRFRMETTSTAEIFLKMSSSEEILVVGRIDAGQLNITSEEFSLMPPITPDVVNGTDWACWTGLTGPDPPSKGEPQLEENGEGQSGTSFTSADAEFYEMIAYLSGICAGIFVVFFIGLAIVVRSFVPKKKKSSPPSSVCSMRTRD